MSAKLWFWLLNRLSVETKEVILEVDVMAGLSVSYDDITAACDNICKEFADPADGAGGVLYYQFSDDTGIPLEIPADQEATELLLSEWRGDGSLTALLSSGHLEQLHILFIDML
jgi:hypothetical protein